MTWTRAEKEFLELHYLRMSNKQLAMALGKSENSVSAQLSRLVPSRLMIKNRELEWDLPFGCQVTKRLPRLADLQCCEVHLASKGVPYIICQGSGGFAVFRAIIGNSDIDGEEPPRSSWVKCHNHPVYGKSLP